jgi:hypothetical protein
LETINKENSMVIRKKTNAQKKNGRPTCRLERITPEKAQKYMGLNDNFRKLNRRAAQLFAEQMKAGEWLLTGEPIIFDDSGALVDGQHRLKAIELAGVAVDMMVTRGVQRGNDIEIDAGSKRTMAQYMTYLGHPSGSMLAAATVLAMRYERGAREGDLVRQQQNYPSIRQAVDWVDRNPAIHDSVRAATGLSPLMSGTHGAFIHYEMTKADGGDPEYATEFINGIKSPAAGDRSSPMVGLRERFRRAEARFVKIPRFEALILAVRAQRAFARGETKKTFLVARSRADAKAVLKLPEILYYGSPPQATTRKARKGATKR